MHHPISVTLSPAVQETLDLMLEFSGDRYPDDICGKKAMADAAKIIQTQSKILLQAANALENSQSEMRDLSFEHPSREQNDAAIDAIRAYLAHGAARDVKDERAAFEEWAIANQMTSAAGADRLDYPLGRCLWRAWQAGAALSAQSAHEQALGIDAARYRWIRMRSRSEAYDAGVEWNWYEQDPHELDAVIDAAMSAA